MKKRFFFFFILTTPLLCFGQGDTVAVLQPSDLVSDAAVMALLAGVTMVLTYFSKAIPVLGLIPEIKLRAGVSAAVLIVGVAYFRGDFFGSSTFPFITNTLLLVLAAFGVGGSSGWLYDLLRKLIGSNFKSIQ